MTTTTLPEKTPETQEEFEAVLRDPKQVQALFKDGKFGQFVKNYADARHTADESILAKVREETQLVLTQWLKEHGQPRRVNLDPGSGVGQATLNARKSKVYNSKAVGARLDEHYSTSAEFLQAIWHHRATLPNSIELATKATEWQKIQNSFGSVVPADGGFLIPETMRAEILQVALEAAIVRPRARVIPMSSLTLPIPSVDDTSHASSVFGGVIGYWTEEGAGLTESQAKFGRVKLEAKKLTIYSEAPNELVVDAPAFAAFLDQILPAAAAFYEDDAFISGTGVGMPLGVLNGSAKVRATRAANDKVSFADIVAMYVRMLPGSLQTAVWIISPAVIAQLLQLVLTVTTGDSVSPPLWLTNQQGITGPTMTLLGRPVIVSEKVPDLGAGDEIAFVDFGYYLIGDRQMMQASSSAHYKFANDVTAYRIVERVDGRPWLNSAITPKNGGDTLTPIVGLTPNV